MSWGLLWLLPGCWRRENPFFREGPGGSTALVARMAGAQCPVGGSPERSPRFSPGHSFVAKDPRSRSQEKSLCLRPGQGGAVVGACWSQEHVGRAWGGSSGCEQDPLPAALRVETQTLEAVLGYSSQVAWALWSVANQTIFKPCRTLKSEGHGCKPLADPLQGAPCSPGRVSGWIPKMLQVFPVPHPLLKAPSSC